MKKIIILCCIAIFTISCNKNKKANFKYQIKGYIYNSIDSTPFVNTQFKQYKLNSTLSGKKVEETYFTTDQNGRFDFITAHSGGLVWPAFFEGAAYTGPTYFTIPSSASSITDEINRIYIENFDTIYTTPFH